MPVQTVTMRNGLCSKYGSLALFGAVYTTAPGGSQGTEPTGGSPAYARKSLSWSTPSSSVTNVTVTFDIPAGTTIVGAGVHSLVTGGTYLDGATVTSQVFAGQGTYTVTFTFTAV